MTTTLEAVARAMAYAEAVRRTAGDDLEERRARLTERWWPGYVHLARAALSALLPVSEEMGAILIEYVDWDHAGHVVIDGKGAFTAAINHILQEQ